MFHNLIKEIWTAAPGLDNLLLSGIDGIIVAKHLDLDEDDFLAAEAANLVKEGLRFGREMETGELFNMTTYYEKKVVMIQMVTEEYFLLGILDEPKYLGKIRYKFKLKAHEWYSVIA